MIKYISKEFNLKDKEDYELKIELENEKIIDKEEENCMEEEEINEIDNEREGVYTIDLKKLSKINNIKMIYLTIDYDDIGYENNIINYDFLMMCFRFGVSGKTIISKNMLISIFEAEIKNYKIKYNEKNIEIPMIIFDNYFNISELIYSATKIYFFNALINKFKIKCYGMYNEVIINKINKQLVVLAKTYPYQIYGNGEIKIPIQNGAKGIIIQIHNIYEHIIEDNEIEDNEIEKVEIDDKEIDIIKYKINQKTIYIIPLSIDFENIGNIKKMFKNNVSNDLSKNLDSDIKIKIKKETDNYLFIISDITINIFCSEKGIGGLGYN